MRTVRVVEARRRLSSLLSELEGRGPVLIEGYAPETPDFSPGRKARSDLKKPST
jgi:hypothetical protein